MADAGGIAVLPDGDLTCCENLAEGSRIGNVREGITDRDARRSFARMDKPPERCRDCVFLPECTSFASCPKYEAHCKETRMMTVLEELKRLADGTSDGTGDAEEDRTEPHDSEKRADEQKRG